MSKNSFSMKARIKIVYGHIGGFSLERELTEAESQKLERERVLEGKLMAIDETFQCMTHYPDSGCFILQDAHFYGSTGLPDPKIFKEHMSSYIKNGWSLLKNSEYGFFATSPNFKRAIYPSFGERIKNSTRTEAYQGASSKGPA